MAKATATVTVSQAEWDAKFASTTELLKDLGGTDAKDSDDLPEGAANKYDTGAPPADTDELAEGAANKYDTGVPPADLEALPDGATRKAMLDAEKTKLTGIEAEAKGDQTGAEIQTAIKSLAWGDRDIVVSEPEVGERKVRGVHRNAADELEYDYDTVAES